MGDLTFSNQYVVATFVMYIFATGLSILDFAFTAKLNQYNQSLYDFTITVINSLVSIDFLGFASENNITDVSAHLPALCLQVAILIYYYNVFKKHTDEVVSHPHN